VVKFRNKGPAVSLFAPEDQPGAVSVDAGEVVEIEGEAAKSTRHKGLEAAGITELPDDATLVVLPDGDVRAFAHSHWELIETKTKSSDGGNTE
jgi:hypothetical protein